MSGEGASSSDDLNKAEKKVKETQGTKRKRAETEEYSPLFVQSFPPRIISKKFKLDPEKWRRGCGLVFRNSCLMHTTWLKWRKKLSLRNDEKSRLDVSAIKAIAGQFKTTRVAQRNMRKHVLSKAVYYRCGDYEQEMELRRQLEDEDEARGILDGLGSIVSNVESKKAEEIHKTYKDATQQASGAFLQYLQGTCTDEESAMGAQIFADKIKQIYTEKISQYGITFLKFFESTKTIVSFSDKKLEDDVEKTARVLTVFLEGLDVPEKGETNSKPAKACKAITVEEFFSPEVLKQLEWYKPRSKRLTKEDREALERQKKHEEAQISRRQEDVQYHYWLYLRSQNNKDAQKQAGAIKEAFRKLTAEFGTDRHKDLLHIFEPRQNVYGLEENEVVEDFDVKRVKLLAVLLDGPADSKDDGKTCVPEGESENLEVHQEIKVEDFFSPEILKQLMNSTAQ